MSKKVRRKRVNWFNVLCKVGSDEMHDYFFAIFKKLRRGKSISSNRAAYYTLKHFYSTTTIAELCKKVGI